MEKSAASVSVLSCNTHPNVSARTVGNYAPAADLAGVAALVTVVVHAGVRWLRPLRSGAAVAGHRLPEQHHRHLLLVQRLLPSDPVRWFTIHGLWPSYARGYGPTCCNHSDFDMAKITNLTTELGKYWPSLYCSSPSLCSGGHGSLWAHEPVDCTDGGSGRENDDVDYARSCGGDSSGAARRFVVANMLAFFVAF
ncbi:hypothetical protein ACP70R_006066 [Stipagrostis hirtigluma subsp. patula]